MSPGLALGIFGLGMNFIMGMNAASEQRKARNQEAHARLMTGIRESTRHLEDLEDVLSAQKLAIAAAGSDVAGTSALLLYKKTLDEGIKDAADIRKYGAEEAGYIRSRGKAEARIQEMRTIGSAFATGAQLYGFYGGGSAAKSPSSSGVTYEVNPRMADIANRTS